ncbi:MAG: chromosome segregation protein ScpA [Pedosphaera sp.]|nr:chromosome segregation protein ScpA [Pedosphaera sp.]
MSLPDPIPTKLLEIPDAHSNPKARERWCQIPLGFVNEYRVQFDVFEGPLDLLLHLVKKQEIDIYQVNLTRIASEFVAYIDQIRELDLEVAGEFLVMAATLIYIKSRELLPADKKPEFESADEDDEDPRFELIRRLVEYKRFKDAAALLQVREGEMELIYERRPERLDFDEPTPIRRATASVFDLIEAVNSILKRVAAQGYSQEIQEDPYTVSEKMAFLRDLILQRGTFHFSELFATARTRTEVVVTFLAVLELTRLHHLILTQGDDFGEILIGAAPLEEVTAALIDPPLEATQESRSSSATDLARDALDGEIGDEEDLPVEAFQITEKILSS